MITFAFYIILSITVDMDSRSFKLEAFVWNTYSAKRYFKRLL